MAPRHCNSILSGHTLAGLISVDIQSHWTWSSTLLQSANQAFQYVSLLHSVFILLECSAAYYRNKYCICDKEELAPTFLCQLASQNVVCAHQRIMIS